MQSEYSTYSQNLNVQPYLWHPLKVYSYYRLLLSWLLLGAFFVEFKQPLIGAHNTALYLNTSIFYVLASILTLIAIQLRPSINKLFCFVVVCSDILLITILAHASGGIKSHLSILLVVAVAAGGIMITGRVATLIAAVATLAILYEQLYFSLIFEKTGVQFSLHAGFLGITFFTTSFLAQMIAERLRESEALRSQTTRNLANLENLNHHIIQRMRTGIVVVNNALKVQLLNESARKMLGLSSHPTTGNLSEISETLSRQVTQWQQDPILPSSPFKATAASPEINANMADLRNEYGDNILIFLDDTSRLTQQAQQLKLASLGQLTAAIAHEIRNPLGAISHAAQLLMESDQLPKDDHRLASIIQQHSLRVNGIIESVLNLSRRNRAQPQLLELSTWLNKFIQDFSNHHSSRHKKEAIITTDLPQTGLQVRFDPVQLNQVLVNLVENGLRYSLKHCQSAKVKLKGGVDPESELPYLQVMDYGSGVPEKNRPHLFEPFFTSETQGTGLGLYISRELCEMNHARLDYLPEEAPGACFRISFAHPNKILAN